MSWVAAGNVGGYVTPAWVFDTGIWVGPYAGALSPPPDPTLITGYDQLSYYVADPFTGSMSDFTPDNLYDADLYRSGGGLSTSTSGFVGDRTGQHLYVVLYPAGYPSDLTGTDPTPLDPLDLVPVEYGGHYPLAAPGFIGWGIPI